MSGKRMDCLMACEELHKLDALSDYLMPDSVDANSTSSTSENYGKSECEISGEELHEMLVPSIFRGSWIRNEGRVTLRFYYIRFNPIPNDRDYRMFGLFTNSPLPKEAECLQVELHLSHSRIVKTELVPCGEIEVSDEEIVLAQNFQEMWLKLILDRSELFPDFVSLGSYRGHDNLSSKLYLLLPVRQHKNMESMTIDWTTIRRCLSSPVFSGVTDMIRKGPVSHDTVELLSGPVKIDDVLNSLVFTPHNKLFFFVDSILPRLNASSRKNGSEDVSFAEHNMNESGITSSHQGKPLLKAKQLFKLRNLLRDRVHNAAAAREKEEHFQKLPPELCALKIVGFSKDIGNSLSLLPSFMHRLENILVAIELKDVLCSTFSEASEVQAQFVLEALTTDKCSERFSLERLEVLGDAFLKYAVGHHIFLSCEGLNEGQMSEKRSSIVKNSNLYALAVRKNLQVYIRDELFEPTQFFALGRPCQIVCAEDMHQLQTHSLRTGAEAANLKCSKFHRRLHRKTISDVVEALVGAFLVRSGFKAAISFLGWIGISADFDASNVHRACELSKRNISLLNTVNINEIETLLGHKFNSKGLLLEALVHPSFTRHCGGCYQKLEFLGDAVMDYLITSYLYSVYPDLNPGQLTDLRSLSVNNIAFAYVALSRSLHKYLIKDSDSLTEAIKVFENYVNSSDSQRDLLEEAPCPKVLGDIVESSVGAILLDTGFNLRYVWNLMLNLMQSILSFSSLPLNPVKELLELCQYFKFELTFPVAVKVVDGYLVNVEVNVDGKVSIFDCVNKSSKAGRKVAAREALSDLKDRGYKHKTKSLEELLRETRILEAKLIGYNEEPIIMYNDNDCFEKAYSERSPMWEPQHVNNGVVSSSSRHSCRGESKNAMPNHPHEYENNIEIAIQNDVQENENAEASVLSPLDASHHEKRKSLLMELCSANRWKPPVFERYKVEACPHSRIMCSCKVTVEVEIEGAYCSVLVCFGDGRPEIRDAEEHAAEGALWYLKQLGL